MTISLNGQSNQKLYLKTVFAEAAVVYRSLVFTDFIRCFDNFCITLFYINLLKNKILDKTILKSNHVAIV